MRRALLVLSVPLLLTSVRAQGVTVISRWVVPTRPTPTWDLKPHERTRPIVVGDEVIYFANLDGSVYAMQRKDGYLLWKNKMPGAVQGALAYGRSKIIVGDNRGNLVALRTHDGSESWRFKANAEWLAPPLVVKDRIIAMTAAEEVYALQDSTVDGKVKELWHYSRRGDEKMTIRGGATPVVFGTEIFQGFSDGYLVALGLADGKELWPKRLRTRERFYDVDATAFVDEKSVIAATFDGKVSSFDRVTRDLQWVYPVGSYAGFLVEGDSVYFSGLDGNVHAVNRATGAPLWKTPFGKGVGLQPALAGNFLVVTTSSDPLLVLDPKDGKILYRHNLGTGSLAGPVGTKDGWFFCMSNYGNLYAFEILKERRELEGPGTQPAPSAFYRTGPRPVEAATPVEAAPTPVPAG